MELKESRNRAKENTSSNARAKIIKERDSITTLNYHSTFKKFKIEKNTPRLSKEKLPRVKKKPPIPR